MNKWMGNFEWWGTVYAPDNRESGVIQSMEWADGVPDSERFDALMSLALDGQLNEVEAAEFDRMLAEDAALDDVWRDWQAVDFAFQSAPNMEPPRDFVASFEARLARQERRRRLWLGAGMLGIATLLWSSLVLGLAGAGAYVMFNQSNWLATAVRIVAQSYAAVEYQLEMLAAAMTSAFSTPEGQGMAIAYFAFAGLALWFWARFLRRSVGDSAAARAHVS